MNVLGPVGLTPPLVVPHLCHQLQVSLGFVLLLTCRGDGQTEQEGGDRKTDQQGTDGQTSAV